MLREGFVSLCALALVACVAPTSWDESGGGIKGVGEAAALFSGPSDPAAASALGLGQLEYVRSVFRNNPSISSRDFPRFFQNGGPRMPVGVRTLIHAAKDGKAYAMAQGIDPAEYKGSDAHLERVREIFDWMDYTFCLDPERFACDPEAPIDEGLLFYMLGYTTWSIYQVDATHCAVDFEQETDPSYGDDTVGCLADYLLEGSAGSFQYEGGGLEGRVLRRLGCIEVQADATELPDPEASCTELPYYMMF